MTFIEYHQYSIRIGAAKPSLFGMPVNVGSFGIISAIENSRKSNSYR